MDKKEKTEEQRRAKAEQRRIAGEQRKAAGKTAKGPPTNVSSPYASPSAAALGLASEGSHGPKPLISMRQKTMVQGLAPAPRI
ncbi:hypothetical protein FACS189468_2520 [Spirochaetia bacterium]|nr:hypothetical protein FACS189468_2520 [Spirochaetia bacterium]